MQPGPPPQKGSSSTLLKVFLIGCVGIVVIGTIAFMAMFYYGKKVFNQQVHKIENIGGGSDSEYGRKAEKLKEEHPFTAPADMVITEDQLNRFIAVRKSVYEVYKLHEPEIKSMGSQDHSGGVSDVWKGMEFVNDMRLAQVNAQEQQNMSPDEYKFVASMVYAGWFAKLAKDGLKGEKSYEDAANDQFKKQEDEIDRQLADPNVPEATKEQLRKARDLVESQKKTITNGFHGFDESLSKIPQQDVDLFTKHKEEIEKYSMGGLEMFGLI